MRITAVRGIVPHRVAYATGICFDNREELLKRKLFVALYEKD